MRVYHQLKDLPSDASPAAVAIGNFDGCHLGHQALLIGMLSHSRKEGLASSVLTFYPHPVEVLNPQKRLERLMTTAEKLEFLERLGIANTFVAPFDTRVAGLSPEAFFRTYLVDGMKAKSVHVGGDFRFGHGRKGDAQWLAQHCQDSGIGFFPAAEVAQGGNRISSTRIRQLVQEGEIKKAAELLGHFYGLRGQVGPGEGRGKTIGFPTANILVPADKLLPKHGVYVTRAIWQQQVFASVTNVGLRPTFHSDGAKATVEAHFIDFQTKLYDETIQLDFLERLRDEKKFASVQELTEQIQRDVVTAKQKFFGIQRG